MNKSRRELGVVEVLSDLGPCDVHNPRDLASFVKSPTLGLFRLSGPSRSTSGHPVFNPVVRGLLTRRVLKRKEG
jgi:hypothetical protein